ncbi:hypothetical protein QAD02_001439 [Eretmocerus hayati]|uniref:Uncharacterized protein n=1 Tax=Eretmocerus hayati TaxID=131215 RepID=A0ACC2NG60_9HYME|nr:hypothetical protein QAD02_001439 [Eretmocerus hayati]
MSYDSSLETAVTPTKTDAEASNKIAFPIDSNTDVERAERDFFEKYNFVEYDENSVDHDTNLRTIINSRILGKCFVQSDTTMNVKATSLEECFPEGHSLSIDTDRSYVVPLIYDLDCIRCKLDQVRTENVLVSNIRMRRDSAEHLTNTLIHEIMERVLKSNDSVLSRLTNRYSVFRRRSFVTNGGNCGAHVHVPALVSLPTYRLLVEEMRLAAENLCVKIDSPTLLPLPMSAKIFANPYERLHPITYDQIIVGASSNFYDIVRISSVPNNGVSSKDVFRFYSKYHKQLLDFTLVFAEIFLGQTEAHNLEQKFNRVVSRSEIVHSSFDDKKRTKLDIFHVQDTSITSFERERRTLSPDVYLEFMNEFVSRSALWHDGMAVQHFVVALCLRLQLTSKCADFTSFLCTLYRDYTQNDPVLLRFVQRFDPIVAKEYHSKFKEILDFLFVEVSMNLPLGYKMSELVDEQLLHCLNHEFGCNMTNISHIKSEIKNKTFVTHDLLCAIRSVYTRLKILTCEQSTWYVYRDNGFFESLPSLRKICKGYFQISQDEIDSVFRDVDLSEFTPIQPFSLLSCCDIGLFNPVTGLYATRIPLVRSIKRRYYVVAPQCSREISNSYDPDDKTKSVNRLLLQSYDNFSKFSDILLDRVAFLYVSYVLAPCLVDLANVTSVTSLQMEEIVLMIDKPSDDMFLNLSYLVDYYNVDPKFVGSIICLLQLAENDGPVNSGYGEKVLIDFESMKKFMFPPTVQRLYSSDKNAWNERLVQILPKIRVPEREPNETHLDRLTRITFQDGDHDRLTASEVLYASVFSVLMIKRFGTHGPLLNSPILYDDPSNMKLYARGIVVPDISSLPDNLRFSFGQLYTPYEKYQRMMNCIKEAIVSETDVTCEKNEKMNEEDELRVDDYVVMIMYMFCVLIAGNFNQSSVKLILTSLGITMLSENVRKIAVVFVGPKSTGKSLFMDLIQNQTGPAVHRQKSMENAEERASVSSRNTVCIYNEAKKINAGDLKSGTGNDKQSGQMFFKQVYESLDNNRAFFYGATNGLLEVVDRSNCDQVFIDRLYSVIFSMRNVDKPIPSLFAYVVESKCPKKLFEFDVKNLARAQSIMCFLTYERLRNPETYGPHLVDRSEDVTNYQHQVYALNSDAYKMMSSAGFTKADGFFIEVEKFRSEMCRYIKNRCKDDDQSKQLILKFFDSFEKEFTEIDYKRDSAYLQNVQSDRLIRHVQKNFTLQRKTGAVLSQMHYQERLTTCYKEDNILRENAENWFLSVYSAITDANGDINDMEFECHSPTPYS